LAQLSLEQVAALGLELVQELALVQELELVVELALAQVERRQLRSRLLKSEMR
jgi:hypothetical protein